jgi:DNA-directed RNA polymerase
LLHQRRDFFEGPHEWPEQWPTIEEQVQLELDMVSQGVLRFHKIQQELQEKMCESRTRYGRTLIASLVDKVSAGIKEIQDTPTNGRDISRKKLLKADADEAAYLSLVTVVDYLGSKMPLTAVAKRVGQFVQDQILIKEWIACDEQHAKMRVQELTEKTLTGRSRSSESLRHYVTTTEQFEDAEKHLWSNKECIHVGVKLIDNIIRTTGLVKLNLVPISKGKVQNFIVATDETLEWVKKFNEFHEGAKPRFSPCIIPPRDWVSPYDGGYYSELNNQVKLIKKY